MNNGKIRKQHPLFMYFSILITERRNWIKKRQSLKNKSTYFKYYFEIINIIIEKNEMKQQNTTEEVITLYYIKLFNK